ncbi:uroporphyrinogen-III C-methyltransferase [Calidifontibacter indicus]|uniref:uroporphyrinogen-III C-methyltransferase n=1 Tax=Calidifontibacter indicus TaxID=419650 RepID=A0A3D9UJ76_9MICO|nr:uroporphyrinogen-III C-methyltransferase [Calidifontibacter indicus]REF29492.1 uroporphyrin-III C-methyltransferase [Calidifontibacter indicus]
MTFWKPGDRALLRRPGTDADHAVHRLLEAGFRVDVETQTPGPRLLDLQSRGLVGIVTHPDLDDYAVVLRDDVRRADAPTGSTGPGRVTLVGGGPGPTELLTVAGLAAVREADVVVCDRLAPLGALTGISAEIVHVGKIPRGEFTPQERINRLLVEHAQRGRNVVRLKGGDNFVFGRGGEEWNACRAAGIEVRVVPGVSSALAAPALAGVPVTHRDITQGFAVVSGHVPPDDPRSTVDWDGIARSGLTLVVLMGVATLPAICRRLIAAGLDPHTPAASISDGGLPSQQSVRGTLASIAADAEAAGIRAPAVTVIGATVDALDAACVDRLAATR